MNYNPFIQCLAITLLAASPTATAQTASFTSPDFAAQISRRVEEILPTASEKRLDEIGWAKDIRSAEKLARENHRPVFLFTHDGRINLGRC